MPHRTYPLQGSQSALFCIRVHRHVVFAEVLHSSVHQFLPNEIGVVDCHYVLGQLLERVTGIIEHSGCQDQFADRDVIVRIARFR